MGYYVLAADQSRAVLFTRKQKFSPLEPKRQYEHAEGRLHAGDLVTDQPGSSFASSGPGRHAMTTEVSPKEEEADKFARELADDLHSMLASTKQFDLILVAPPQFLGRLRDSLSGTIAESVVLSIDKNLVAENGETIQATIDERLRVG